MNPSRLSLYKEALALEERKAALESELAAIVSRLIPIQSQLFGGGSPAQTTVIPKTPARTSVKAKARAGRGELKTAILQALEVAGDVGVKVADLSKELGVNTANIYAWFNVAKKRHPLVKKIGPAHYQLLAADKPSAKVTKPTRKKGRRAKRRRMVAAAAPADSK